MQAYSMSFVKYIAILWQLHELIIKDDDESEAAEELREQMDKYWDRAKKM